MRTIGILLCLLVFMSSCSNNKSAPSALDADGNLNWLTVEELNKISDTGNKKIMVDMYTDWCGWCKVMDKKTFTDEKVKQYLNDNFLVVKFNAEQKESVEFKGKKYDFNPRQGRKGTHDLATELLNGRLGYPSMVYLDENFERITSSPGYKTPEQLISELEGLQKG